MHSLMVCGISAEKFANEESFFVILLKLSIQELSYLINSRQSAGVNDYVLITCLDFSVSVPNE